MRHTIFLMIIALLFSCAKTDLISLDNLQEIENFTPYIVIDTTHYVYPECCITTTTMHTFNDKVFYMSFDSLANQSNLYINYLDSMTVSDTIYIKAPFITSYNVDNLDEGVFAVYLDFGDCSIDITVKDALINKTYNTTLNDYIN